MKQWKRMLALIGAAVLTAGSVPSIPMDKVQAEGVSVQQAEGGTSQFVNYVSDLAGWQITEGPNGDKSGDIKTQNGEMTLSGFQGIAFDAKAPSLRDGTMTVRLKSSQLDSLMLVFRYKDRDNFASLGFGTNNVMYVWRKDGTESYNISQFDYDYTNKEYVTLKCEFQGTVAKLSIDGQLAAAWDAIGWTEAGQAGIRTWGSPKDITVASMTCTDIVLDTAKILDTIERAKTFVKEDYTEESFAALEAAIKAAEDAVANAQIQSEIDSANAALEEAINALKPANGNRIEVWEDYTAGPGQAVWSKEYSTEENGLAFSLDVGETVVNKNKKMSEVKDGLYTWQVKTDARGRFGVAFNGSILYSEEAGTYLFQTPGGEEQVFAEDNLKLKGETWYDVKVMKSGDLLRLYVDGRLVESKEVSGLDNSAVSGGIGLYNPASEAGKMLIRRCGVYELHTYTNDFSTEEALGEWETENAEVSYAASGEIDGSGEVRLQMNGVSRAIAKDTPRIADGIYEFDVKDNAQVGTGRLGFLFRTVGMDRFEAVYYDVGTTWGVRTKVPGSQGEWAQDTTFANGVKFTENEKHHVRMEVEGDSVKIWLDDSYIGAVSLARQANNGYFGFMKWYNSAELRLDNLKVRETVSVTPEIPEAEPVTLKDGSMEVTFDRNFPYIIKYELNGKSLAGNTKGQNAVIINGDTYYPVVSCDEESGKELVYTLEIPSAKVDMKVRYKLDGQDIRMTVEDIHEKGDVKVQTFQFKDETLAATGEDMSKASMGMTVYQTGETGYPTMQDTLWASMNDAVPGASNQSYAMLASDGLALAVNNSTINTKARFNCTVTEENGVKKGHIGNGTFDRILPGNDKTYEPSVTITVCEDYNGDGTVDYQDAAANYKHIRTEVYGDDIMKDNLIWIAYNSVSQAQEPFMRSLDLGKQVYNFTDGFEQMIMHKGYQAEGHDTQHGLYAYNVGERQGGEDDFKAVMEAGKKYGMKFGIHVNVNEHHVESMNEDVMRTPLSPGWGLWSQAYWVDQGADVTSGNREQRLKMLKEELPDLAFIYYDIYGNDGAPVWMGQSLAEVTNGMDMILATEFNGPLEQQAAFTHWGNDPDYANVGNESRLMRYFKNDTDIYIGNALLMGNKMLNIGTWQAMNTDMKRGVDTFYNHVLPTKYLQHFDLLDYEQDYAQFSGDVRTERQGDTVVMTKKGEKIASWTWSNQANSYGQTQEVTGDATLLIPWYGQDSKEKNPDEAAKLYYWNPEGGQTTWNVSVHDGWEDGTKADVYRLTTDAKEKVGEVTVSNGQITIDQEAGYGYVLYPSGAEPQKATVNFGEGTPLDDPNFIDDKGSAWKLDGQTQITKDEGYNPYLSFEGEGSASQTMTALKPGKTYTVYGFADVAEGSSLKMSVTVDGKTYENTYGPSEIVYRGIPRYADQDKHTQKVRIVFDVPEGVTEADLKFEGSGNVRLQDLRVWENITRTPQITDEGMENYILYEDFENVEQGYGPFIVDSRHTGWDAPVQMAEYRESRPEYDTDEEKWQQYSDYVANGRYSLKTDIGGNGFDAGGTENGPVYRSIPGAVKFEPNTEYKINFKYVTGVDDRHNIEIRDKDGNIVYQYSFKATQREEGKHSLATAEETAVFTTGDRDDYYIVVNLIDNKAGLTPSVDENGSIMERCFLSLDDISIQKVVEQETVDKTALEAAIKEAESKQEQDYTKESWKPFAEALEQARAIYADETASQEAVDAAAKDLKEKMDALKTSDETGNNPGGGTGDEETPGGGGQSPDKGQDMTEDETVRTGDNNHVLGYIVLLTGAGVVSAVAIARRRKSK